MELFTNFEPNIVETLASPKLTNKVPEFKQGVFESMVTSVVSRFAVEQWKKTKKMVGASED